MICYFFFYFFGKWINSSHLFVIYTYDAFYMTSKTYLPHTTMVEKYVINRVWLVLYAVNHGMQSKPAHKFQLQSASVQLSVWHHSSFVVLRVVSPCAEVPGVGKLLGFAKVFVHSSVAKPVVKVGLVYNKLRAIDEVLKQPNVGNSSLNISGVFFSKFELTIELLNKTYLGKMCLQFMSILRLNLLTIIIQKILVRINNLVDCFAQQAHFYYFSNL